MCRFGEPNRLLGLIVNTILLQEHHYSRQAMMLAAGPAGPCMVSMRWRLQKRTLLPRFATISPRFRPYSLSQTAVYKPGRHSHPRS